MRTIEITEPTSANGKPYVPGDIEQFDVLTADSIVCAGKGRQVPDGTVQTRDPVVENRDPKPETAAEKKARQKAEAEAKAAAENKTE